VSAFAKLVDDPVLLGRVTRVFEETIAKSFDGKHKMRHMTQAEVKRRFDMCAKIFSKLRSDLKWGIERIVDSLPGFLDQELSGSDWVPDARTIWAPGDGV
jgi:hypothetical protein